MMRTEEPRTEQTYVTALLENHKDWDRLCEWYGDGTSTLAVKLSADKDEALRQLAIQTANRIKFQRMFAERLDMPQNLSDAHIEYFKAYCNNVDPLKDIGDFYMAAGWLWDRYEEWIFDNADSNGAYKCDNTISGTADLMRKVIVMAWEPAELIDNSQPCEFWEF